ncbi:short-chain dehydrogenase [Armillaria luteobubalina]|uniref:Short-chain dehydrogenase n=1 Tax=Armillaria luteobubalina TaxID=153913 RepID=A0AA39U2Z3_9AGAR|nr:short-chain dehydrogenase [Armillaria luteobubalina]
MADLNVATIMSLNGRVGLVTGGGTGIGFIIAKAFAANGAKVYITGRRLEVLEKAAASVTGVRGSIIPLRMDVTNEESLKTGTKHIEVNDGKLDILVNKLVYDAPASPYPDIFVVPDSADPFATQTLSQKNGQNWADMFALNTIAPFFVVRAFQSLLIQGAQSRPQGTSSVINISSAAAKLNVSGTFLSLAYGPTKAALEKLTLILGTSFAGRDIPIRVNALEPGIFASQLTSTELLESLKTKPAPGLVAPIPVRRHGSDAEMGMSAVYLAASDYTNGAILNVDGGAMLVNP